MRITDHELDSLENGAGQLEDLAHLLARIIKANADSATSRELRNLGILWELVGESARELKTITKPYESARN